VYISLLLLLLVVAWSGYSRVVIPILERRRLIK
jgi:hypothetical protein